MNRRVRMRPSKPASFMGMIVGGIFVFIGIFMVIPTFGFFGIFWTLMACAITGSQAYNLFSKKGMASWEMDIEESQSQPVPKVDFEEKLVKLNRLKEEGLISEEEFQSKRDEVMREKW